MTPIALLKPLFIRPARSNWRWILHRKLMQRRKRNTIIQGQIMLSIRLPRTRKDMSRSLRNALAQAIWIPFLFATVVAAQGQELGTIFFDFDSATLDAEGQAKVVAIAKSLDASPSYRPSVVIGHTDAVGSASYNTQLGLRRAQAVADALVASGVPVSRIGSVSSRGKTDLVVMVATAERLNRRVVVSLDDMLAACRSYRDIDLNPAGFGDAFEADLRSRLVEAAGAFERFSADGQNAPAFQMSGAAKYDCGIAAGLGANEPRKLEYGQRCFCNSARLRVALGT
ncbi:OmpA family protein [Palleronia sp. KMU-117]|uniref:OmpA family protein n=1 Tax=Palleronia sp. KMU-117 TaxID=3434108 RepID=UPI003D753FC4